MPGGIRSALWGAAPWLILAAAAWIGIASILPPAAVGAAAPAEDFSAERAFTHIEAIARRDRPIGSPGNAAARDYVVSELEAMGVTVDLQRFSAPDYYGDGADPVTLVNIVGLIPGTDPTGSIVLMGHYDTYPGAPGANDDAAAIATVLESGRAVLAGPPRRNDIILLLTDGEEPAPRFGSTEFVARHPLADAVGLVVNFEGHIQQLSQARDGLWDRVPPWQVVARLVAELTGESGFDTISGLRRCLAAEEPAFAQIDLNAVGPTGVRVGARKA